MGDLFADQELGNDARHMPVRRKSRIRQRAHQPDPRAAVDQAHPALGECAPQLSSGRVVLTPGPQAGAGKDTDALHA